MIEIVKPTPDLIEHFVANLRYADVVELSYVGARSPRKRREGLLESVRISHHVEVIMIGGEPAVIGGVAKGVFLGWSCVWAMGTPIVYEHPVAFTRVCAERIRAFHDIGGEVLFNFVPEVSVQNRRWLRAIGFKEGPRAVLPNGAVCVLAYHVL